MSNRVLAILLALLLTGCAAKHEPCVLPKMPVDTGKFTGGSTVFRFIPCDSPCWCVCIESGCSPLPCGAVEPEGEKR